MGYGLSKLRLNTKHPNLDHRSQTSSIKRSYAYEEVELDTVDPFLAGGGGPPGPPPALGFVTPPLSVRVAAFLISEAAAVSIPNAIQPKIPSSMFSPRRE